MEEAKLSTEPAKRYVLASTFQWTIALILTLGGALNGVLWYYALGVSSRTWENQSDVKVLRALQETSGRGTVDRISELSRRIDELRADVLRSQPASRP